MKQQLRQLSLKNQARDKDETLRQLLDELLDISEEVDLMNEIKDIHDELVMIKSIFASQLDVILQFNENNTYRDSVKPLPPSVIDKCNHLYEIVDQRRAKIEEMDETAARAYKSLNNLFDLKRMCYVPSTHNYYLFLLMEYRETSQRPRSTLLTKSFPRQRSQLYRFAYPKRRIHHLPSPDLHGAVLLHGC